MSDAFRELRIAYKLNLMPHWTVMCGVDEIAGFYVTRHFEQERSSEKFPIKPTEKSCRFIYDWMLETAIRVEQTVAERWQKIEEIIGSRI
jgi:hypothetical protein